MRRARTRPTRIVSSRAARSLTAAALGAATLVGLVVPSAHADTDPVVTAFVKSFVTGFEKSSGTTIPTAEATCIGTKFLAKVTTGELLKAAADPNIALTKPQKAALASAMGACLSGPTYKAVLKHNLASQFTPGQLTCISDKAVAQLGVAKLMELDFKDYVGNGTTASMAKTTTALQAIALACAKK